MRNGRYQSDSSECWYRDDVLHREDGPALLLVAEPVVVENHILSLRKKFFNR